jgi:putative Mg2+ transporter-C (MgtC) family protein
MNTMLVQLSSFVHKSIGFENFIMIFNLLFALLLGVVVGYERSYNGRAAGMRTYGLVAMASCALIITLAHPEFWYNESAADIPESDPTRVIQGIVTGIGFLCGGVILKDNFSISGLTTAASIWSCAVIGILVGLGFYIEATIYSILQFSLMFWLFQLEIILPSKHSLIINLVFNREQMQHIDEVKLVLEQANYQILAGSISLKYNCNECGLTLQAISHQKKNSNTLIMIANQLKNLNNIKNVNLSYSRL